MSQEDEKWDVFISYASEDLDAVASPLAQLLGQMGLRVWFDRLELKVGDSLRERIDRGLSSSRFGVVVLSNAFFEKHWPTRELNGLAQREAEGQKVILPIWHGIDENVVRRFSPPLADRVAIAWTKGLYTVAGQLIEVIRPDIATRLRARANRIVALTPMKSGRDLALVIAYSHMFQFFNHAAETREQSEEIASFLQQLQDWGDIWSDLEAGGRVEAEFSMQQALEDLRSSGWNVYGGRTKRKVKTSGTIADFDLAVVAIVKGAPPVIFLDRNHVIIPKPTDDAV